MSQITGGLRRKNHIAAQLSQSYLPLTVAEQSKKQLPQMELWTQYGLEHPVKWEVALATKLSRASKLKKRNYRKIQTPEKAPVHTPQPEPTATTPQEPVIGLMDIMEKSRKYLESTAPASLSWIHKLLGKLNRLKNYRLLR